MVLEFRDAAHAPDPEARQVAAQLGQGRIVHEAGQVERTVGIQGRRAIADEQTVEFLGHRLRVDDAGREDQLFPGPFERRVAAFGEDRVGRRQLPQQDLARRRQQQARGEGVQVGAGLVFAGQGMRHGDRGADGVISRSGSVLG